MEIFRPDAFMAVNFGTVIRRGSGAMGSTGAAMEKVESESRPFAGLPTASLSARLLVHKGTARAPQARA